jgi:CRISPR/Cas system CSM-associated protein Csm3 (group 7 of RAMP superfamily)
MILNYTITFYDYWHISSGLSAGARLDSTVIKDENFLPYVPGKVIKGLTREMGEQLNRPEFIEKCFGTQGINAGECYFTNAVMASDTAELIRSNHLQSKLYDIISSTKIDDNGVAADKSLREIEVVVPLQLMGQIHDIAHSNDFENMKRSVTMIKRMGLNRNRGLGRCAFAVEVSQ